MKNYVTSICFLSGLALSMTLVGCADDTTASKSPTTNYNSTTKKVPSVSTIPTVKTTGDAKPVTPVPAVTPVVPAKAALSVSVALTPTLLSTKNEGFFPRGTKLANGSQVVSYGQDFADFHTILAEISADDGKTWSALGEIAREPFIAGVTEVIGDPTITVLPTGTLLSAYRNLGADGSFHLQASTSIDGGKTWAFAGDIDVTTNAALKGQKPTLLVTSKGVLQIYYTKAPSAGAKLNVVMRSSADEGKTWKPEVIVATGNLNNTAFPGVALLKDGSILVVFDTFRSDTETFQIIRSVQSNSDGLTWSAPIDVYVPANPQKIAKFPQVTVLDDGRPAVVFMTDEDAIVAGGGCCAIKVLIAQNVASFNSLAWSPQAVVAITAASDIFFPSATPAANGAFLLVYEKARKVLINRVNIKGGL